MSLLREAQRCLANQAARKSLNAFITLPDTAAVLRQVELTESQASQRSPLAGRLIAFKDNICTTDAPTTCASALLRSFTSPYDATVVQRLRASGALVAGKTNLDEFGMGSHCLNSHFGPVSQQSRPDGGDAGESVSAGGSSGGSAVAVATEQCWAALGTDTGGSVRLPAAYTGIVGFKPSYGLVSRWGVVAYANSLDTVGVLARDTQTARQVFHAINHHDPNDPTSLPPSTRSRLPITTTKARSPLRIGIPTDYNIAELTPPVRRAWLVTLARLSALGHALVPVALPTTHQALSAYYVLAPAEASSNLAKYDGVRYGSRAAGPDGGDAVLFSRTRGEGFGDEVKRRIVLGAYTLSAEAMDSYFIQAQRVRRLVQRDFDCAFSARNPLLDEGDAGVVKEQENEGERGGVDVLVSPTAPSLPPRVEGLRDAEPVDAYMNDVFTVPASLAGLPAVSVPVEGEGGEMVGMQVIAQYGGDDLVLDVAEMIERK